MGEKIFYKEKYSKWSGRWHIISFSKFLCSIFQSVPILKFWNRIIFKVTSLRNLFLVNFFIIFDMRAFKKSHSLLFSLSLNFYIFSASVCRRWRQIAYDTKLWKNVSLRPEVSGECDSELIKVNKLTFHNFSAFLISPLLGLHVGSLESLLAMISVRFGPSLRYIELPIELITHTVLHELAAKCPNLTHMLLDFSTAMQLHDFSDMQASIIMLKRDITFATINLPLHCRPSQRNWNTCVFAYLRSSLWKGLWERFTILLMVLRFCIWSEHMKRPTRRRRKFMWEIFSYTC